MAIEVLKTAAAAYQGRSSDAAKPVKAADSAKPKKTASEADRAAAQAAVSDTDVVKPMQPVTGNDGEKGESLGGGYGGQTSRQLQQAVDKLRKNMMARTEAVFGIHEGTNRVMIKIVDKDTKDIIKEYPPEQTLDMIQKVWEMAGIMVDERG